ncbi:hypothetical protein GCM10010429_52040 [Micromonospora olivasterospora]
MLAPGRRLICATCPSTHTQPRRAIHAPTFWLTTRTGHGSSALLFGTSVTRPPYGPGPTPPETIMTLPAMSISPAAVNLMINGVRPAPAAAVVTVAAGVGAEGDT